MNFVSTSWQKRSRRDRALRRRADAARDRRDWAEASVLYERYLAAAPDDMPIWIQLGHARKENGDPAGAVAAYRHGLALAPHDADAHLQLGHALKLAGRPDEARNTYRRALELDPESPAAQELTAIGDEDGVPANCPPVAPTAARNADTDQANRLRAQGDAARDAREWPSAVIHYASYLRLVPGDAAIWVQFGHATKETGDAAEAERAYRRAHSLSRNDADPLLHLGHMLHGLGRSKDARETLASAYRIEPGFACHQALVALDAIAHNGADATHGIGLSLSDHLLIDVSDLLDFVDANGAVTGIQRVQSGIAAAVADGAGLGRFSGFAFVFTLPGDTRVWRLHWSDFSAVIGHCTTQAFDLDRARALVVRARSNALATVPGKGSLYFIAGAFWGRRNAASFYRAVKRHGARLGVLVHDIFPITHPELVGDGVLDHFEPQFLRGLMFWDVIVANSRHTAREVARFIADRGLRPVPVRPVALAHRMGSWSGPAPATMSTAMPAAIRALSGKPFVLCVGTIEARKNHAALFQVWRLLRQGGIEPPPLVLVGRVGWRVENLIEQARIAGMLGTDIRLIDDASDAELSHLYSTCLFTVLPSLTEGWGLPIGESLDHGKICVTSNLGSMPEAGGEFAVYVDPYNVRALHDVVLRLITRRSERSVLEHRISEAFRPRLWCDVAADIALALTQVETDLPPPPQPALIGLGASLAMTTPNGMPYNLSAAVGIELALVRGWCAPEPDLVWLDGQSGRLELRTDAPVGARVRLAMLFTGVSWANGNRLHVSTPVGHQRIAIVPGRRFVATVEGVVGDDGLVEVALLLEGSTEPLPPETRRIRIGLNAVTVRDAGPVALSPLEPLDFGQPLCADRDWSAAARGAALLGTGWTAVDGDLPRITAPRAKLAFRAGEQAGERVRVVIDLVSDDAPVGAAIAIGARGGPMRTFGLPSRSGPLRVWIDCRTGPAGTVRIVLAQTFAAPSDGPAPRIALQRLCHADPITPEGRLALLEALILGNPADAQSARVAVPAAPLPEIDHRPDPFRRARAWLESAVS